MIKYEKHKQEVENRGYIYIGTYTKGEYTIDKHLYMNCMTYIRVKCSYCGAEYDVRINNFKRGQNCGKCCNRYENSFAYYIQQELGEGLNKYWDFEKNTINPYHIYKNSNKKVWIKCIKVDYHGSYEVSCGKFIKGNRCSYCHSKKVHPKDSFAQWGIDNIDPNFIEKYWSNKNSINPFAIAPNSKNKVLIKCQETDYHGDYLITCNSFYSGNRCPYCSNQKVHPKDSFGQWLIDTYGDDSLDKYWSNKNTVEPFNIALQSNKKVWIKCQDIDYHDDYLVSCSNFYKGNRCPYCSHRSDKVHPLDSFGSLYPEKAKYWSSKNKKSPYEVLPHSNKKFWFVCEDCGSEFETALSNITENKRSMKCLNCTSSKGEQKIKDWLDKNNIKFIPQKQFNNLIGLKGGNLSYDFYLPNNNLLIEYQGEFHDGTVKYQTKEQFKKQQEHDKRKKEYAQNHNIDLLEIWYWDYDKINKILKKEII